MITINLITEDRDTRGTLKRLAHNYGKTAAVDAYRHPNVLNYNSKPVAGSASQSTGKARAQFGAMQNVTKWGARDNRLTINPNKSEGDVKSQLGRIAALGAKKGMLTQKAEAERTAGNVATAVPVHKRRVLGSANDTPHRGTPPRGMNTPYLKGAVTYNGEDK